MKSVNTFSLSGRLTSDARYFDSKNGKVARFTIAHNFGKGMPALFLDAVMFEERIQGHHHTGGAPHERKSRPCYRISPSKR